MRILNIRREVLEIKSQELHKERKKGFHLLGREGGPDDSGGERSILSPLYM
jgi:hypothetical protein